MQSCLIIDDEDHAIELLSSQLQNISFITISATFDNPVKALDYLQNNTVDIIFIDVEMPQMSGIEFVKIIDKRIKVILVTAYRDYAFEGYENGVVGYLLKPVQFDKLYSALLKSREHIAGQTNSASKEPGTYRESENFIIVKADSKNKFIKINLSDIVYIEGLKNYLSIFTENRRIITLLNIKSLEDQLSGHKFIRTHKSYIISLEKIESVDGNQIFLKNTSQAVPLSETYRDKLLSLIKKGLVENKKNTDQYL